MEATEVKIGMLLKITKGPEASKYKDRVFKVWAEPWMIDGGEVYVLVFERCGGVPLKYFEKY